MDKWNKKATASNREYNTSPYRKSDGVLLIRTEAESVILDLPYKESVEEDDIIFIKDREQTPTLILKRQRGPQSIGRGEEKPKISTPSSSEESSSEDDDDEDVKKVKWKKVFPKVQCNICKKEVKLGAQRIRRNSKHWHLYCI